MPYSIFMRFLNCWKKNLTKRQLIATMVAFLLESTALFSQEIRINYLNTDNFPVMEAGFTAYTKEKARIYNSTIQDFFISENGKENKILEVINPEQNYQPVSVVMMIDISMSMNGARTILLKEGLADFIDQIPLESSEVAVACFSDEIYIYSDFTQNRNRLAMALNKVQTINGTNFNKAFLDPVQGALEISRTAKYKKVIVFVTDGLGTTDAEQISALAREMDAAVFVLNLHLSVPDDLKTLTTNTGGLYFEKIWNDVQFRSASSAIFQKLRCTDQGTLKWLSTLDCNPTREVSMVYRKQSIDFNYEVPSGKVGKIELSPSLMQFGSGKPGMIQQQKLNIVAHNIPVTLNTVDIDSSDAFAIDTFKLPMNLNAEDPFRLNVRFKAPDAGIFSNQLKISFKECPDIRVNLHAGGDEQIKLVFPVGGEIFTIGSDTTVLWEGVKRSQDVAISFKLHNRDEWKPLNKAKNLKYIWNLPNDTSKEARIRLTPLRSEDENMEITATFDAGRFPLESMFYSPTGDRIITNDQDAFVKTWEAETGKIITSLGGYEAEKAIISPLNQQLMMFLKEEVLNWSLDQDRLASRISRISKRVSTSLILPNGEERLVAGNLSVDPAKNAKAWSVLTPNKVFLVNQPDLKWASFTADGKYAVTLDGKNNVGIFLSDSSRLRHQIMIKETINEVLLSPANAYAVARIPAGLCVMDIASGKELYRLPNVDYKQFSPGGNFLLIKNADRTRSISMVNLSTGKTILSFLDSRAYKFSDASEFLMLNKQDTLKLMRLQDKKVIFNLTGKSARNIVFNKDASKVFVITAGNILEIYETETGTLLGTIDGFSRKIRDFALNPAKQQFAILMEDNRVEIWSAGEPKEMKEAVSGTFSIVSPKPTVMDTIRFGEQPVNITTDLSVDKFISNPTPFPVTIQKIEIMGRDSGLFGISNHDFPRKVAAKTTNAEEFRFTPVSQGTFEAVARTYTATDSFKTVLLGNSRISTIKYLLKYCDFGTVKVGLQKDTLAAVLVNMDSDTLKLSGFTNNGPDEKQFSILVNKEVSVSPKDTLKLPLRFSPVWRGKTTTLLVPKQRPGDDKIILRGEGTAPRETWIKGITRNSSDSLPLSARVVCMDLSAQRRMEEITTADNGKYLIRLQSDRNFGIMAKKENFISTSVNIDLSENMPADTIYKDVYLTEIKPGALIRLNCIFFEFDKANLLLESESDLKRMLEIIKSRPNMYFEIHGHTDAMGNDAYNMNLSKTRASAVMNYLIKNGGNKEKLSIRYFGESKPVADNATDEGRALNRRVEMKVVR